MERAEAVPVPAGSGRGGYIGVLAVGAGAVALMLLFLGMGLRRRDPPVYPISPLEPRSAEGRLVGPELFTVDATAPDRWVFFSFHDGTVVEKPGPRDWDLAFRRFQVIANGGKGFAGDGGIADLGDVPFDRVRTAPEEGYVTNRVRSDTVNAAIADWYDYSFLSHLLSPLPRVYAVRTAEGRYAKMEFVGYYCPGATPGCVTFRSVYQADGSPALAGS